MEKFAFFQEKMKHDPKMKVTRESWEDSAYIFWSAHFKIFLKFDSGTGTTKEWFWRDSTQATADLTANDWKITEE